MTWPEPVSTRLACCRADYETRPAAVLRVSPLPEPPGCSAVEIFIICGKVIPSLASHWLATP